MKKKFLAPILSFVILASFFTVLTTHAACDSNVEKCDTNPGAETGVIKLDNPFNTGDSLDALLTNIIDNIIFPIGGILAVLAFIYSGFKYVSARGDTGAIKEAHRALLYTVIGTAVLLGAKVIADVISGTVNQLK